MSHCIKRKPQYKPSESEGPENEEIRAKTGKERETTTEKAQGGTNFLPGNEGSTSTCNEGR